jgi:hypothetical protein
MIPQVHYFKKKTYREREKKCVRSRKKSYVALLWNTDRERERDFFFAPRNRAREWSIIIIVIVIIIIARFCEQMVTGGER